VASRAGSRRTDAGELEVEAKPAVILDGFHRSYRSAKAQQRREVRRRN
jgi:hypothetical protein